MEQTRYQALATSTVCVFGRLGRITSWFVERSSNGESHCGVRIALWRLRFWLNRMASQEGEDNVEY